MGPEIAALPDAALDMQDLRLLVGSLLLRGANRASCDVSGLEPRSVQLLDTASHLQGTSGFLCVALRFDCLMAGRRWPAHVCVFAAAATVCL